MTDYSTWAEFGLENGLSQSTGFVIFVAVHGLALTSMVWARLLTRSFARTCSHGIFCGLLVTIGVGTIFLLGIGSGAWLASATTFGIMAVGATFHSGPDRATAM